LVSRVIKCKLVVVDSVPTLLSKEFFFVEPDQFKRLINREGLISEHFANDYIFILYDNFTHIDQSFQRRLLGGLSRLTFVTSTVAYFGEPGRARNNYEPIGRMLLPEVPALRSNIFRFP